MSYQLPITNFAFCFLLSAFCFLPFTMLHAQNLPPDSLAFRELDAVEVLTNAPESLEKTFSSTVITRTDIQNNLGNGSINNLFDLIPSMITTSDAGTGVGYTYMRLRGIDQTRINVTFNGVALNDAESQGTWLVNLPDLGNVVHSLNVQRGAGMSNNGAAAFGASMNFNTIQTNYQPFVELTSAAGSFYTFRNSITAATGIIKDRIAATVSYSNILSNGYMNHSKARLNSLFFTTDIFLPKKIKTNISKLKMNILYGNEKTGLAWNGVPSDSLRTNRRYNSCGEYYLDEKLQHYDNETDNYQQTHYQLFYDYKNLKRKFEMNIGAHLTRGIGYYEQYKEDKEFSAYRLPNLEIGDTTLKRSDFITRKYLDNYFYGVVFNAVKEYEIKGEHVLFWSTRAALNHYDGKHYGTVIWGKYLVDSISPDYQWYYGTGKKLQGNIVASLGYTYKGWFAYFDFQYRYIHYKIAGIDDDDMRDITKNYVWDNFLNPKVALHYTWKKRDIEHTAYFSFAVANREPTRSDLIDAMYGITPHAETLYDFELGYTVNMNKFRFNANGYYMLYDNQLVLTGQINDVGAAIMTNVKNSYRLGLELVANYQPVKFFHWKISGTFSLNKILNYEHYMEEYDEDWNPVDSLIRTFMKSATISFSPAIVASNIFQFYPFKNFSINLFTQFVSKQYLDNSQDNRYILKPYSVSNLNLRYDIPKLKKMHLSLFFSINNIFNAKYESNAWIYRTQVGKEEYYEDGYFPQAGINFLGGVKLRF
jgi:iron complex outermembrane receptor protein